MKQVKYFIMGMSVSQFPLQKSSVFSRPVLIFRSVCVMESIVYEPQITHGSVCETRARDIRTDLPQRSKAEL